MVSDKTCKFLSSILLLCLGNTVPRWNRLKEIYFLRTSEAWQVFPLCNKTVVFVKLYTMATIIPMNLVTIVYLPLNDWIKKL
jgi:hypothetical protein